MPSLLLEKDFVNMKPSLTNGVIDMLRSFVNGYNM